MPQCSGQYAGRQIISVAQAHHQLVELGAEDHAAILETCNSYVCPRGATPGHATILGLYPDVQAWHNLNYGSQTPQTLILGSDQGQLSVPMVFLTAEQIVPGAQNDPNGLFVCHLADIRWLMQRSTFTRAYNVRPLGNPTVEYWSDSENPNAATLYNGNPGPGVGPWTWTTMLADIWSRLPANASFAPPPTIPESVSVPLQNPERFRFIEASPLAAYSEALLTVFNDVAYNPATNTFSVVELGEPDNNFTTLQGILSGSLLDATNPIDSLGTWFPYSVDVLFLALYSGTPEQPVTEYPYYVLNVVPSSYPLAAAFPAPGTTDFIFAPLDAQMPCSGILSVANWQASTAYNLGQKVQPSPTNGHTYVCSTAGTSGTSQPAWPTGTGATIGDGGVVWTESTVYPTNITAMQSEANYLVNAYYGTLDGALRRKIWIYSGIAGFVPGSQVDQVEWRLGTDGATTTVSAVG